MKKVKAIGKTLLVVGAMTLFASCSNEDHQETSDLLSELQSTKKDEMQSRE